MKTVVNLWEVITTRSMDGKAWGVTFNDETAARAYSRDMQRHGYEVSLSPCFQTEASADLALIAAGRFYEDDRLDPPRIKLTGKIGGFQND